MGIEGGPVMQGVLVVVIGLLERQSNLPVCLLDLILCGTGADGQLVIELRLLDHGGRWVASVGR